MSMKQNLNMNVFWIFIVIGVYKGHCQCPGITSELGNTAVQVGTDVVLNVIACQSVTNEVFVWSKVHPIMGNERLWQSAFPDDISTGYSVTYPDDFTTEGHYRLVIGDIALELGGVYRAEFLLGLLPPVTFGSVVVLNPMSDPPACPPEGQVVTEGDEVVILCEVSAYGARDGFHPQLTWHGFDTNTTLLEGVDPEASVRTSLTVTATPSMHLSSYTCELTFDDVRVDYSDFCSTHYDVQYGAASIDFYPAPSTMGGAAVEMYVGDVINCTAIANPAPVYTWNCSEGTVVMGSNLQITHESEAGDSINCTCTAENVINGVTHSLTKDVTILIFEMDATTGSVSSSNAEMDATTGSVSSSNAEMDATTDTVSSSNPGADNESGREISTLITDPTTLSENISTIGQGDRNPTTSEKHQEDNTSKGTDNGNIDGVSITTEGLEDAGSRDCSTTVYSTWLTSAVTFLLIKMW